MAQSVELANEVAGAAVLVDAPFGEVRTEVDEACVRNFTSRSYEWIVKGDIKACVDEISDVELMDRLRERIGDTRVLRLVARLHSPVAGRHGEPDTGRVARPVRGAGQLAGRVGSLVADQVDLDEPRSFA